MTFTIRLFRIVISNNYYKSNSIQNDFDIQPIKSITSWMKEYRIRILYYSNGIELIWLSQGYDYPLELFKKKTDGITISFIMILKNRQIFNFSQLETGYPSGQIYYLYNRPKKNNVNNSFLHNESFISESDRIKIENFTHYNSSISNYNIFAIIDIDFSYCINNLLKKKYNFLIQPITYSIIINNRSTFWRYYLVSNKIYTDNTLIILYKEDDSYFKRVKYCTMFSYTYYAESTIPLALFDQYDYYFSLYELDKRNPKNRKLLLDKLPYPTHNLLKKDIFNKNKIYSDIIVYI